MNMAFDEPKTLRNYLARQDRFDRIFDPHMSPLTNFVDDIRRETGLGRAIPYFDPLDGGVNARCLFLFEAPGPRAVVSGFISRNNPDETAKNFFKLNDEATLPRELTISWNIVPWYIGSGKKIRPANTKDIVQAKKYLFRLLSLLPRLRVVVLSGKKAQKAESFLKDKNLTVALIKMPHPSPLFVNNSRENKYKILRHLRDVKQLLANEN